MNIKKRKPLLNGKIKKNKARELAMLHSHVREGIYREYPFLEPKGIRLLNPDE